MIFKGLSLSVIAGIAATAILSLFLLHMLKRRHKDVTVPTVFFWQQAMESSHANQLWGRLASIATLLLTLFIVLLLCFAGLYPVADTGQRTVVIMDNAAVTDHEQAVDLAVQIMNNTENCSLIISGSTNSTRTGFSDTVTVVKAELNSFQLCDSIVSSIDSAVREALAVTVPEDIYVISGQELDFADNVNVLYVPLTGKYTGSSVNVWAEELIRVPVEIFCDSSERYCFINDPDLADVKITEDDLAGLSDWRTAEFIADFSELLGMRSGLYGKKYVNSHIMAGMAGKVPVVANNSVPDIFTVVCMLIFVFMLADLWLWRKGVIV